MKKVEIATTAKVTHASFVRALQVLVEMPVSNVEDFKKRRRCIEILGKLPDDATHVSFESDDFKFIKAQFNWALSQRALAGNDTWEIIYNALEGAKEE